MPEQEGLEQRSKSDLISKCHLRGFVALTFRQLKPIVSTREDSGAVTCVLQVSGETLMVPPVLVHDVAKHEMRSNGQIQIKRRSVEDLPDFHNHRCGS